MPQAAHKHHHVNATNGHVLIVDNEPLLSWTLTKVLEGAGYETVCHTSVTEAAEAIKHLEFELAIIDDRLPDGSGCDVVKLMHMHNPNTVTLMLSAECDSEREDCIRTCPVDEVMEKPFDIDAVLDRARYYLGVVFE